jgi:nucleotide-binding universal stress UspA family protein
MFEHILVPLDGSALAEKVLPHAVTMGQTFAARITLLRVVERGPDAEMQSVIDPLNWEIRKSEAQAYLDQIRARLAETDLQVDQILSEGSAAERIIGFAQENEVDLIVISSHGRSGLSAWNINSVVQKVILGAHTPSLIVRAYRPVPSELRGLRYRRVLVPLDGSQRAECVISLAAALVRPTDSTMLLAHVVAEPEAPRRIAMNDEEQELVDRLTELNRQQARAYLEGAASRLSVETELHVLEGNTPVALHELVQTRDVDLVVLNAHGYSGEAAWPYGSVALNFIAYGNTPLLIMQDIPREEMGITAAKKAAQERKGH